MMKTTMKAVGYRQNRPIEAADSLFDLTLLIPECGIHDLLVKIEAISVNPVDTKVRALMAPEADQAKVLGWDAVGIVETVGLAVSGFKVGDRIWYAGDISRPGTNSEYHLVDYRIASLSPTSLSNSEAAALPLTSLTAHELLFDRLAINREADNSQVSLLVVGAAGGVGSILLQLARQLTNINIIATAARPESQDWVKSLGAHDVIDHSGDMPSQIQALHCPPIQYIASLSHTDTHLAALAEMIAPQGKLALIDDPTQFDILPFKSKSVSIHWEFMYTRSLFETDDMQQQQVILQEVAALIDAGKIKTTVAEHYGVINADNLKKAHALLESGQARGKIVLEGF